jgi:hypothetical protein
MTCTGFPEMLVTSSGEAPVTMSTAALARTSQPSPTSSRVHATGSVTFMSPRSL